jgi:hypothetical protein
MISDHDLRLFQSFRSMPDMTLLGTELLAAVIEARRYYTGVINSHAACARALTLYVVSDKRHSYVLCLTARVNAAKAAKKKLSVKIGKLRKRLSAKTPNAASIQVAGHVAVSALDALGDVVEELPLPLRTTPAHVTAYLRAHNGMQRHSRGLPDSVDRTEDVVSDRAALEKEEAFLDVLFTSMRIEPAAVRNE